MNAKKFIWIILLGACLFGGGCVGPHYTKHQIVIFGKPAPCITNLDVAAIERNLSIIPAPKVGLLGVVTGVATTPLFKCLGLQGWKDYQMSAEAQGIVVQNRVSTDRFFTVDMKLNSLKVSGTPIPLSDCRFIRLEIFLGDVPVERPMITNGVAITAKGKFVWDTDGWFEIHPQQKSDVVYAKHDN